MRLKTKTVQSNESYHGEGVILEIKIDIQNAYLSQSCGIVQKNKSRCY